MLYRNFCQACHQSDGRGQDKLAPTLIDSTLALAAPEVPVRVLLHGKERDRPDAADRSRR